VKAHCFPNGSNASCQTVEKGEKGIIKLPAITNLAKVTSTGAVNYLRKPVSEVGNVQNIKLIFCYKNKLMQR